MTGALDTPRLQLRPLEPGDEALYVRLYSDPVSMARIAEPQTPEAAARGFRAALAAQAQVPPQRLFWVMHERVLHQDVGLLGLDLDEPGGGEVGALIPPEHQGRGYATEAIAALADHAFGTLGLQRLHTRHAAGHGLAHGLMQGLGFLPGEPEPGPHPQRWSLTPERWARRQGRGDPLT
jgi:RimJ/RimL family protein N-acetyltransferase